MSALPIYDDGGGESSDPSESWDPYVKTVITVKNWYLLFCDSSLLILVIATILRITFLKEQHPSMSIVIQLAILVVTYIGFELRNFYRVIHTDTNMNSDSMTAWIWYPYSVSLSLWLL